MNPRAAIPRPPRACRICGERRWVMVGPLGDIKWCTKCDGPVPLTKG